MASTWPLVGRRDELALLTAALADDRARGVVLSGPAGVGKTRLAAELVEHAAAEHGCATAAVSGNRSLAGIPFGAFADFLPGDEVATVSLLDVMRRARAELLRRRAHRRLVLVVDDAHLLDDASAGLTLRLAVSRDAFVVVTVRAGERAPDGVRALWKDGIAERFELRPLTWHQTGELLAEVLGGQVDSTTAHRMWQASEGNVLLLRELVLLGVAQGRLARRHGVWGWPGPLGAGARLVELIDDRLAGLPARLRTAIEVLAMGEPLSAATFEGMVGTDVARALEAADLLSAVPVGARSTARVAHPLYAETLRAQLRPLRRREICRQLAAAGDGDVLRTAVWQLDGGGRVDADTLVEAARRAVWIFDHPLAERLARAALAADGGAPAAVVLAGALQAQGRAVECRAVLAPLDLGGASPALRTQHAITASVNQFFGFGELDAAVATLSDAQARLPAGDHRDALLSQHEEILYFSGRAVEAAAVAESALNRAGIGEQSRLRLGSGLVRSLGGLGATGRALALADELSGGEVRSVNGGPTVADRIASARVNAYWHGGRYREMEAGAVELYELLVTRDAHDLRGFVAGQLGRAQLWQGRVGTARRLLREATAQLRECDVLGMLPFMLALLARAEAHLGAETEAAAALVEAEDRANPAVIVMLPDVLSARAWVAAGAGRLAVARCHARESVDQASRVCAPAKELEGLHDLVRLGEPGLAARLSRVSAGIEHVLGPTYADHATALYRRDAAGLERCAERFAEHGVLLLAAEASVEAAEAYAAAGRVTPERAALTRAQGWADRCEGARTPVLARAGRPPTAAALTAREREIAELAMTGLSNADIAERLVLSRRTVANHLNNAYGKLGISRRGDLAVHLRGPAATSAADR